MFIKVVTDIYIEVKDAEEAEDACRALGTLDDVLRRNSFPVGEPIGSDVQHWAHLTAEEISERGFDE